MAIGQDRTYSTTDGIIRIGFDGIASSVIAQSLASLAPGESEFVDVGNLNTPVDGLYANESDFNISAQDWCMFIPYDPVLYLAAGMGAGAGQNAPGSTDLQHTIWRNTWDVIRNPYGNVELVHYYTSNTIDTDEHILFKMPRFNDGRSYFRNLITGERGQTSYPSLPAGLGGWPGGNYNAVHAVAYAPWMGNQGQFVHSTTNSTSAIINLLDKETPAWTNIGPYESPDYRLAETTASQVAIHANHFAQKVVVCGGNAGNFCNIINADGSITNVDDLPPTADVFPDSLWLPHPYANKSILYNEPTQNALVLDYDTGSWSTESVTGAALTAISNNRTWAYVPHNISGGGIVFQVYNGSGGSQVVTYKPL